MSDLYPTPTRRRLLADVANVDSHGNGRVAREYWPGREPADMNYGRKVSSAIAELHQAGWVALDERIWEVLDAVTGTPYQRRYWLLTDAGRAVLADG